MTQAPDASAPRRDRRLLCPSARGETGGSVLIGVVTSQPEGPRITPTARALPVTAEILELAQPAGPSEVFRFAAPCRSAGCPHFQREACQLAARGVDLLHPVVDQLPKCAIRAQCRWFRQEGPAICRRCPQVITDQYDPSETMIQIVNGVGA